MRFGPGVPQVGRAYNSSGERRGATEVPLEPAG